MERQNYLLVPGAVLGDARLSGYAKVVYVFLLRWAAPESGECVARLRDLSARTRWPVRRVRQGVAELRAAGHLERRQTQHGAIYRPLGASCRRTTSA